MRILRNANAFWKSLPNFLVTKSHVARSCLKQSYGHKDLAMRKMMRMDERPQHFSYFEKIATGWGLLPYSLWAMEQERSFFTFIGHYLVLFLCIRFTLVFPQPKDLLQVIMSTDSIKRKSPPHAFKPRHTYRRASCGPLLFRWCHEFLHWVNVIPPQRALITSPLEWHSSKDV